MCKARQGDAICQRITRGLLSLRLSLQMWCCCGAARNFSLPLPFPFLPALCPQGWQRLQVLCLVGQLTSRFSYLLRPSIHLFCWSFLSWRPGYPETQRVSLPRRCLKPLSWWRWTPLIRSPWGSPRIVSLAAPVTRFGTPSICFPVLVTRISCLFPLSSTLWVLSRHNIPSYLSHPKSR